MLLGSFICPLRVCMGSSRSKKIMNVRLNDNSNLTVGMNQSMNGCLSVSNLTL